MAKQYKTGLIITGDASGGIRAIKATDNELGKLNQGFDQGSRRSRQFNQDVNATSQGLTVLKRAAAPIAGAIAGMFAANTLQNQIDWGDQLQKTNLRIGASTESLSQYNYVAKLSGVEFGQLTTAWQRQTRRIAEAATGTGVASKALDRLGLSAKDLNQLAPEEQFERIAAAMQNVESSSERVALAQKLWDSEGVKLVQIVNQGTDAIAAMRAEADALGLTISQDTANAMATYNDEVDRLKFAAQGLSQTLAGELVPTMTSGLQATSAFIQEIGGAEVILNALTDVVGITAALLAGRYAAAVATSTQKMIARELSLRAQIKAEVAATAASTRRTAAERQSAMALLSTARIEEQATRGTAAHAFALQQLSVARVRAAEAAGAHTAATNIATAATQRGTVAARGLASAYALVGGPLGLLVGGAGLLYVFRDELNLTGQRAGLTEDQIHDLRDEMKGMSQDDLSGSLSSLNAELDAATIKAATAREELAKLRSESRGSGALGFGGGELGSEISGMQAVAEAQERIAELNDRINVARGETASRIEQNANAFVVYADRIEEANEETRRAEELNKTLSTSAADAADKNTTLANSYENLLDRIQPNRRAARQYAQDVGVLNLALATGRMTTVQYMQAMGLLQESFQAAQRETDNTAKASEDASQRIANSFLSWETVADNTLRRIDDSGQSLWLGLIDGSESALDTVKRGFQQSLAEIAHMLTTQKLTFHVAGMMGLDTTGMPGGGGLNLGSLGGLGNIGKTASKLLGFGAPAAASGTAISGGFMGAAATQSAGSLYGMAATGGVAKAGLASSIASGISTAMPWIAGGLAIDSLLGGGITKAISGLFGGKSRGPSFDLMTTNQDPRTIFEDVQHGVTATGAFGNVGFHGGNTNRLEETFGSFDNATQFLETIAATDDMIAALAPGDVEAMTYAIQQMRLKSSDAAGIADQLGDRTKAAFGAMSGDFGAFARTLSGSTEEIIAQAQAAQQAHALLSDSISRLNLQFDATGAGAYESANSLAQYAGGVQNLTSIQDAYYQAAFSEQERLQNSYNDVRTALGGLTDEAPRTVEELRALVEAQQLNGEAGGKLAVDLMALAPALKEANAGVRQAIEEQYQESMGRAPESAGMDYWFDVVASGSISLASALKTIAGSAEAAEFAAENAADAIDSASGSLKDMEAVAREREQLERQLLQLQGDTNALRKLDLATIDPANRALQQHVWAMQDQAAAAQAAEAAEQSLAQERMGLERQLLQLQGDTAALRAMDLAQLDPSNRALQQRVWAIQDEQQAAADAESEISRVRQALAQTSTASRGASDALSALRSELSSAQNTAQSAWDRYRNQSLELEIGLLELLGDESAIVALQRERELESIDESLRPMQERLWALEDETKAQQAATQAAQDYSSELSRVRGELSNTLGNISGWIDQQNATSGAPGMNLEAAGEQFARQLILAQAGDRDALQSITQYADQYLAAGEQMFASGSGFQRIQEDVLKSLQDLPDQISAEEYLAKEITDKLGEVITSFDDMIKLSLADEIERAIFASEYTIGALIDFAVGSNDLPDDLRTVLGSQSHRLDSTINYLIGTNELDKDDRALALNATNNLVSTIDQLLGSELEWDDKRLALNTTNTLSSTVDLALGDDVSAETRQLALINSNTLTSTINAVQDPGIHENTKKLALKATNRISTTVNAAMGPSVDWRARDLAITASNTIATSVNAAMGSHVNWRARDLALEQSNELDATVNAALGLADVDAQALALNTTNAIGTAVNASLGDNVSSQARLLALKSTNSIRSFVDARMGDNVDWRARNLGLESANNISSYVNAALGSDLDDDALKLALEGGTDFTATLKTAWEDGKLDADEKLLLRAQSDSITKTLIAEGGLDLTEDQLAIINAASGDKQLSLLADVAFKDADIKAIGDVAENTKDGGKSIAERAKEQLDSLGTLNSGMEGLADGMINLSGNIGGLVEAISQLADIQAEEIRQSQISGAIDSFATSAVGGMNRAMEGRVNEYSSSSSAQSEYGSLGNYLSVYTGRFPLSVSSRTVESWDGVIPGSIDEEWLKDNPDFKLDTANRMGDPRYVHVPTFQDAVEEWERISGSSYSGPRFANGGWTGPGGKYDEAGIVHAEEFVVRSEVVKQPGVRGMLEALNQGQPTRRSTPAAPLPSFPQLGSNDVLQVLQDVKRELQESRKENKRLQEENNRHAAAAVAVQQAGFSGQITEQKKGNAALGTMASKARLDGTRR